MYDFIKLPIKDQAQAFLIASAATGYPAHVVEKDFWVTYMLDTLFNRIPHQHRLMFKGGTSLSKCYKLIDRFSEDIDLSLNMKDLGFGGNNAPHIVGKNSNSIAKKALEDLKLAGEIFLKDNLLPLIQIQIIKDIGANNVWSVSIDTQNPENILFHYPKSLDHGEYGDTYAKPVVLIESGTKAAHEPIEAVEISSFLENAIPDIKTSCIVQVLSPKRTFWEKVTILHAENNINKPARVKERLSRHLYDLIMLYQSPIGQAAIKDIALLDHVSKHKAFYFRSAAAKYEEAKAGTLQIVPQDDLLEAFRQDYEKMGSMFPGDIIPFATIINVLRDLENTINKQ